MRSSMEGSASARPGSTESAASVPAARPAWVGGVRSSVSGTGRTSKWPTGRQVCRCESARTTCSTPAASPPCFMTSTVACRCIASSRGRLARAALPDIGSERSTPSSARGSSSDGGRERLSFASACPPAAAAASGVRGGPRWSKAASNGSSRSSSAPSAGPRAARGARWSVGCGTHSCKQLASTRTCCPLRETPPRLRACMSASMRATARAPKSARHSAGAGSSTTACWPATMTTSSATLWPVLTVILTGFCLSLRRRVPGLAASSSRAASEAAGWSAKVPGVSPRACAASAQLGSTGPRICIHSGGSPASTAPGKRVSPCARMPATSILTVVTPSRFLSTLTTGCCTCRRSIGGAVSRACSQMTTWRARVGRCVARVGRALGGARARCACVVVRAACSRSGIMHMRAAGFGWLASPAALRRGCMG